MSELCAVHIADADATRLGRLVASSRRFASTQHCRRRPIICRLNMIRIDEVSSARWRHQREETVEYWTVKFISNGFSFQIPLSATEFASLIHIADTVSKWYLLLRYAGRMRWTLITFFIKMLRCQCPSLCPSVCDGSALAHYS